MRKQREEQADKKRVVYGSRALPEGNKLPGKELWGNRFRKKCLCEKKIQGKYCQGNRLRKWGILGILVLCAIAGSGMYIKGMDLGGFDISIGEGEAPLEWEENPSGGSLEGDSGTEAPWGGGNAQGSEGSQAPSTEETPWQDTGTADWSWEEEGGNAEFSWGEDLTENGWGDGSDNTGTGQVGNTSGGSTWGGGEASQTGNSGQGKPAAPDPQPGTTVESGGTTAAGGGSSDAASHRSDASAGSSAKHTPAPAAKVPPAAKKTPAAKKKPAAKVTPTAKVTPAAKASPTAKATPSAKTTPAATPVPSEALSPAPSPQPTPTVPLSGTPVLTEATAPVLSFYRRQDDEEAAHTKLRIHHEKENIPPCESPVFFVTGDSSVLILSVRINGAECPWHREGKLVVIDQAAEEKNNCVELLALSEAGKKIRYRLQQGCGQQQESP